MRRSRQGFSLVELLLAIAIFATIAAVVSAIFYTGIQTWRTETSAADSMHHIDAVMEQLTAGLRSAYYPESSEPLDKYGFVQENEGDDMPHCSDKISWVKLGPSLVGEDTTYVGVPHRTEIFLCDDSEGPDGAGLYVRAWRLDGQEDDFDPEEDVDPVLLSSAVTGFDCKMVDREKVPEVGEEEPFEWLDEWETTNRVPESVLVSIAVTPAAESKLEPMVFTRRIEIPLATLSWDPFNTATQGQGKGGRGPRRAGGGGRGGVGGTGGGSGGAWGGGGMGGAGGARRMGPGARRSSPNAPAPAPAPAPGGHP